MECECVKSDNYLAPYAVDKNGKLCDDMNCTTSNSKFDFVGFMTKANSNIETAPLWLVYVLSALFILVCISTIVLVIGN